MKRILSTIMLVSFLALVGLPVIGPSLDGSVAYAQATEKQIKDEIAGIKKALAELEKQLSSPRKMSSAGMEKTMTMLKEVSRSLAKSAQELQAERERRGGGE